MESPNITHNPPSTPDAIAAALKKKLLELSIEHEDVRESLHRDIAEATRSAREKAEAEQIRSLNEKLS